MRFMDNSDKLVYYLAKIGQKLQNTKHISNGIIVAAKWRDKKRSPNYANDG